MDHLLIRWFSLYHFTDLFEMTRYPPVRTVLHNWKHQSDIAMLMQAQ